MRPSLWHRHLQHLSPHPPSLAPVRFLALLVTAAISMAAAVASTGAGIPMRVDPSFDPQRLAADERLWYDRLEASIEASRGVIDDRASSGDLYYGGRTVGDHNAALLVALRMTGDRSLLDRVAEVSELYRAQLADAWLDGTTDGYLNWLWLIEPETTTYYGNDLHQADEVIMHGNVALVAYALHLNRDLDASYAEKADFWLGYLENHFLAKWYDRSGADPVTAWEATESQSGNALYRRFVVTRANQLRLAYYLWKMTGNPFYADRASSCASDLSEHMQLNPGSPTSYQWKHQISGSDLGWQRINYAQYFLRVVQEMHLEEFGDFAQESEMERFASTFADVVFPAAGAPYGSMAERVDGSGTVPFNLYNLAGFGRWDDSGFILDRAESEYSTGLSGVSNAAYALLAVVDPVVSSTPHELPSLGSSETSSILRLTGRNPCAGRLSYSVEVGEAAYAHVALWDARGRKVASLVERVLSAGVHTFETDLRGAAPSAGVYLLVARLDGTTQARKITWIP